MSTLLLAVAMPLAIGFGPAVASAGAATPEKTDVMFIFDTSGSMGGVLQEAKEGIKKVIEETRATLGPNTAYGVSNVEDVPGYESGETEFSPQSEEYYETDGEKPWHLWQSVTTEVPKVEEAIEKLSGDEGVAHAGGDGPEAYGRALWETDTNPQVGWREGARHEIVLIADNVPHTPNVNEGIPPEFALTEPSNDGVEAWPNTGEEPGGRFGIAGTQWVPGDSLEFHKTLEMLDVDGKPLAMVNYFHTDESENENYIHYWEYWAKQTGGEALQAKEGGIEEFSTELIKIIKESTSKPLPPCPTGYERVGEGACVKAPPPPPPAPPTLATTSPPTVLTTTSAAFTTTVDPEGLETEVHFEYGPVLGGATAASTATITYGSVTPDQSAGSDFADHTVTATVTGLLPNVIYNVRAVATNSAGSVVGANQTLKTPADPPPPRPVLGKSVNVTPVSGIVYIELPPGATLASAASVSPFSSFAPGAQAVEALTKGQAFIPLTEARQIPVGSILETTGGVVGITTATTASRKGKLQSGDFGAGIFKLLQQRRQKGLTDLDMIDNRSPSKVCATVGKGKAKGKGKALAAKHLSSKVLGRINASGHGHFTVHGQYSAATVRGTVWSVGNRCEGTLTQVKRGVVSVRDFRRRKTITLFTGQSYLAKAPHY